jgi:hypothetical protein
VKTWLLLVAITEGTQPVCLVTPATQACMQGIFTAMGLAGWQRCERACRAQKAFEKHYLSKYSGRRLQWYSALETVVLKARAL